MLAIVERQSALEAAPHGQAYSHIRGLLVTGGTGFIGGAILAEMAATALWPRCQFLVRAKTLAEGRERLRRSMARFLADGDGFPALRDDQLMLGDLAAIGAEHAGRLGEISHVIHCAALTSFSDSPKLHAVNVGHAMQFAEALHRHAPLARFVNVGTAWSIGALRDCIVAELPAARGEERHAVPYTRSKRDFEIELAARFPDMPVVHARPSIVVGHTRLGTAPSASIYWVFRVAQRLRRFTPELSARIDVVPVDWVASSVLSLATRPKLKHRVYHLSAGRHESSTLAEIDAAIQKGLPASDEVPAPYESVPAKELSRVIAQKRALFPGVNARMLGRAMTVYSEFASGGVVFDNSNVRSEGIAGSPSFASYAHLCAATAHLDSIADQMADDLKL